MTRMLKTGLVIAAVTATALGLGGCYTDGSYSSFSVGVSSYDGPRGYGYGYRIYGDRDGDGVPNWADRWPRNPRRD